MSIVVDVNSYFVSDDLIPSKKKKKKPKKLQGV